MRRRGGSAKDSISPPMTYQLEVANCDLKIGFALEFTRKDAVQHGLVQGSGDPVEHGHGVAFVICVLSLSNNHSYSTAAVKAENSPSVGMKKRQRPLLVQDHKL